MLSKKNTKVSAACVGSLNRAQCHRWRMQEASREQLHFLGHHVAPAKGCVTRFSLSGWIHREDKVEGGRVLNMVLREASES